MQTNNKPDYSPYYLPAELCDELKSFEDENFDISIPELDEENQKIVRIYNGSFILERKDKGTCAIFYGQRGLTEEEMTRLRKFSVTLEGSVLRAYSESSKPIHDSCAIPLAADETRKLMEFARRRSESKKLSETKQD